MKLPQSFIDEVLSRIDIIDIIEKRISLKKTGKVNYSGLCPFHQEKTPSFSVNQNKQFYYCFGCKASGNAIGFLMTYDKLSFFEAIEILASKAGLKVPENNQITNTSPQLFALFEKATKYFQAQLLSHQGAQKYLQERGLSQDIIKHFQIGFAPDGWDNLRKSLGNSVETCRQLLEIGLLTARSHEHYYDRFRNRIMFPIKNKRGQIIAFGGRNLDNQMPKYLNSPETTYFHKSRELYGLYDALQANKKINQLIIVEGYLDVIALHQYGIKEAIATLGTAISLQHLQTLFKYSDNLFFCFDGDAAGKTAAWRALEIALPMMNTGHKLNFLILPSEEDPDSYVRKYGAQGFLEKLASSLPLSDFFFQKLQAEGEIESMAGKTRFVHLTSKYLQKIPKGIFQELMYEQLATTIGMSPSKIREIRQHKTEVPKVKKSPSTPTESISPVLRLAICLLIQNPKLATSIEIPEHIYSINMEGIELLLKILSLNQQNPNLTTGSLLEYLIDDNEKQLFKELAAQDLLIPDETWFDELQGALKRVCEIDIELKITHLMKKGSEKGLSTEEKIELQKLLVVKKNYSYSR